MEVGGKHLPGLPWMWMPTLSEERGGNQKMIPYEHFHIIPDGSLKKSFVREVIFTYERLLKGISIKVEKEKCSYMAHCFGPSC